MSDKLSLGLFDKLRSFILIGAVFWGLFVGNFFSGFSQYSGLIVYVALIILLYSIMLTVPFWEIARSFKNIRFMGLSWIAWILALFFLKDHPAVFIGFILYLVTPCTDWFLIFTSMADGDVPLGLALMPTNQIYRLFLFLFICFYSRENSSHFITQLSNSSTNPLSFKGARCFLNSSIKCFSSCHTFLLHDLV